MMINKEVARPNAMSKPSVDDVISRVYYNVDTGFGSIAKTHEQATKLDPSISVADVRSFLAKQEHRQVKRRRKDNSWIPFGPREQFQIDLADFGRESEYRYALLAIDPFTKKLAVVPIRDKTSISTASAVESVLSELDVPNFVYTDDGGEFQGAFEAKLGEYRIEHIVSRSPASFVERAIRTLRDGITVRLVALSMPKKYWWKLVKPVVDQYNDTPHTTTTVKPNEAAELDWDKDREKILEVRAAIEGNAHQGRKYPHISVGDRVKVLRKPGKYGEFKSDFMAWSRETYEVVEIAYEAETPVFFLKGRPRPLRLHEILKVEDVKKAPRRKVTGKQGAAAQLWGGQKAPTGLLREAASTTASSSSAPVSHPTLPAGRVRLRSKTYDPEWHNQHPPPAAQAAEYEARSQRFAAMLSKTLPY